jgi:N-acetylglutamate synthase-like GNAT family acetyltransferase
MTNRIDPQAHAYEDVYRPGTELLIALENEETNHERQEVLFAQLRNLYRQGLILTLAGNDEAALQIAKNRQSIYEAFFLTSGGGIVTREGKRLSLLSHEELDEMLDQGERHPHVNVSGDVGKRIGTIRAMLDGIGKVAVTSAEDWEKEMRTSDGGGTLCYHSSTLSCAPMSPAEEMLFRNVHDKNVSTGAFRPRTEAELQELMKRAYAVRVKKAAIGFFALKPHDDGWVELSAVSALLKNGAGKRLMDSAAEQVRHQGGAPLFALTSPELIDFFARNGMTHRGTVEELRAAPDVPRFVKDYAVAGRNPHVFTKGETEVS